MSNFKKSIFARKNLRKWLAILFFAFGIPSLILWLGVYIFLSEQVSLLNLEISNEIETDLISHSYNYSVENYFQPKFKKLFNQFKGNRSTNIDAQERVISDFTKKWPKESIEVYVFDGNGKQTQTKGSKPEHELLFKILTRDTSEFEPETVKERNDRISAEQAALGKVFPAPYILINKLLNRSDSVIRLGNPKRYSYCYYNIDKSIKDNIAGILIFINMSKLDLFEIFKEINVESKAENTGFIYKNKAFFPGILADFSKEDLNAYSIQYPTNKFKYNNKIVCLNRLNDVTTIVKATNPAKLQYGALAIFVVAYIISAVLFFKLSYDSIVKGNAYKQGMPQKLMALFILCYALPIVSTIFMTFQYLGKLKYTLLQDEISNGRKKLSSLDTGFSGFITSKLVKQRNFTNQLRQNVENKNKLVELADNFYKNNSCDCIHLLSSASELIYTTRILGVESRRYINSTDKVKEKVLESWETRNPSISHDYSNAIKGKIEFGNIANIPLEQLDDDNKNSRRLFLSAALGAMDFYNELNEINSEIPRDVSIILIDSFIESTTQSFFMSATTNLGQFTPITGINERILGYVDVLPSLKNNEAWYCYASIVDLSVFEREYMEEYYKKQKQSKNPEIAKEKIYAISDHYITQNFPELDSYKTFNEILKRCKKDTGSFVHKMNINGKEQLINVLKCANMYHYVLLYLIDTDKIKSVYNSKLAYVISVIIVFLLSGIIIAVLLVKNIITPVNDLMNGMVAFANKDYTYQIPVRSNDEFGELAQSCNEAAETISKETITQDLQKLLPNSSMNCGSYIVEASNTSSRVIPSDFYDFLPLKNGTCAFIIAEISGNDLTSAYYTVTLKTIFNMLTPIFSENPEQILEKLNNEFLEQNKDNRLISCLIGIIDPVNEIIKMVNAGHSFPLLFDNDTEVGEYFSYPSTPLGIRQKDKIKQRTINLKSQTAIFYSNGAITLSDKYGEELGNETFKYIAEEEIKQILNKKDKCNIAERILSRLEENTVKQPWQNDITIITVKERF